MTDAQDLRAALTEALAWMGPDYRQAVDDAMTAITTHFALPDEEQQ